MSPASHPLAFVDADVGLVHAVLTSEESSDTDGVADVVHRLIHVDWVASLLGVDVGLAWGVVYVEAQLRGTEGLDFGTHVEREEMQVSGDVVLLGLDCSLDVEAKVCLVGECQSLPVEGVHLPYGLRAYAHEQVVLVVDEESVGGRHEIVGRLECDVALRELEG